MQYLFISLYVTRKFSLLVIDSFIHHRGFCLPNEEKWNSFRVSRIDFLLVYFVSFIAISWMLPDTFAGICFLFVCILNISYRIAASPQISISLVDISMAGLSQTLLPADNIISTYLETPKFCCKWQLYEAADGCFNHESVFSND